MIWSVIALAVFVVVGVYIWKHWDDDDSSGGSGSSGGGSGAPSVKQ